MLYELMQHFNVEKTLHQARLDRITWLKTRPSVTPSRIYKLRRRFQAFLRRCLIKQKRDNEIRFQRKADAFRAALRAGRLE